MSLVSHSILDPQRLADTDDFEAVVCDYCGSDQCMVLGTLPPLDQLLFPLHRLGATVLNLSGNEIQFVRCKQCGLVYMNPRPTEAAISRFYDRVYAVPGMAESFESDQVARANSLLDTTFAYLDNVEAPSLLDIGCGRGQILAVAQDRGWRVYGSELSAVAARAANANLGREAVYNGDFREMEIDEPLDVIALLEVVEHLRAPMDYLRDAVKLLKPGGVLLIEVPNVDSWEYYAARALHQLYRGFIIEHLYYFTPDFMRRVMVDLGLEVVQMSSRHAVSQLPNPVTDALALLRPAASAEVAPSTGAGSVDLPPLPPVSLPHKVVRQVNNYLMDVISYASQGPAKNEHPAGNTLYLWAKKTR